MKRIMTSSAMTTGAAAAATVEAAVVAMAVALMVAIAGWTWSRRGIRQGSAAGAGKAAVTAAMMAMVGLTGETVALAVAEVKVVLEMD